MQVDANAATLPAGRTDLDGDWSGTQVDQFEVRELIGAGAMGHVYSAYDFALDREVAIKLLPNESGGELSKRFVREARAQARLSSTHVIPIHHVGMAQTAGGDQALYFAMERARGGTLEDLIVRGQTLDVTRARDLMTDIARGLLDAHRAGIIHRDIKPANLLLDEGGAVRIADFGLAKPLAKGMDAITVEGAVVGSAHYISPEQASGEDVDHRTDMYALGCTFFHLLSGRPLFDGDTFLHIATQHIHARPPRMEDVAAHVPRALAAIIDRLLAKNPTERFDDYEQLIAALDEAALSDPEPVARGATAAAIDAAALLVAATTIGWMGAVAYAAFIVVARRSQLCTMGHTGDAR